MDETQCLRMIRASLAPSTGCTEPAAIALNAATARKAAQGTVTQVTARLDAYLFKNAMGVGIPGADERGVDLCVALGITAGDADAGMNALHTVTAEQLAAEYEGEAKPEEDADYEAWLNKTYQMVHDKEVILANQHIVNRQTNHMRIASKHRARK